VSVTGSSIKKIVQMRFHQTLTFRRESLRSDATLALLPEFLGNAHVALTTPIGIGLWNRSRQAACECEMGALQRESNE
jgi:hypothetical protein